MRLAADRGRCRDARAAWSERPQMLVQALARPLAVLLLLAVPAGAVAQPDAPPEPTNAPPHLIRLDGAGAQVVREGATLPLELGDPVLFGDRVDLGEAAGQLLWGDGTRLALDRGARFEALGPSLVAVTAGRALVSTPPTATPLRVDTPAGSFTLAPGGEYRFSLENETTTLGVVRGRADVQNALGDQAVGAGYQVAVRDGLSPESPRPFNAAAYDSFAEWANAPAAAPATGAPLETFADPRFEAYTDVFNRYGAWESDAQYGAVWYPQVGADWRPYAEGYWQSYGPQQDWLWVGRDPWGWPTHHFGRWGVNPRGRWYWMPGRQWAPAWVSWSVGPGHVGWTPLAPEGRPQWGWNTLAQPRGGYPGSTLDPARAWTVVPTDRFGQRTRLGAYAVDPRSLDNLRAFITQGVGPRGRYGAPGLGAGYGPGAFSSGIGPTRVGPPAPGYGPTPPPEDPYERAQRAVAPRSRQRTPGSAGTASPPPPAPPPASPPPASGVSRPRAPRETPPKPAAAPPAPEASPSPPPPAAAEPPSSGRQAPTSTAGRATGSTTGRRAVPRP